MIVDGRQVRDGAEISATVCIVGSGPAGLTLATELHGSGHDVVVLESGGPSIEAWAQSLNDGPVVGDAYAGLRNTRHRQLGGTVNAWNTPVRGEIGAKFVPLEPADFDGRSGGEAPAHWPIDYAELAAYYPRAQAACGLGPFDYEAGPMRAAGRRPFDLGSGHCVSKVYQFGVASRFLEDCARALCTAEGARVCTGLTVCRLEPGARSQVAAVRAVSSTGRRVRVSARLFVLACGAIENARLLLVARDAGLGLVDDPRGWLGRCFMEHPRDTAMALVPETPEIFDQSRFYDACDTADGHTVCGRIAFAAGPPPGSGLPNMSVTLLPRARAAGSFLERLRRGHRRRPRHGYGWSTETDLAKWFDGFRLLINLEQRPRPENRIVLAQETDALGQPRAELHWRWSEEEHDALVRLRQLLATELESSGIGRVAIDQGRRPDPNAHHHAGTTRMAESSEDGVVDPDCRVFGSENLYVAGASVFPAAGFANPTLTIVAMALRLADHLRGRGA